MLKALIILITISLLFTSCTQPTTSLIERITKPLLVTAEQSNDLDYTENGGFEGIATLFKTKNGIDLVKHIQTNIELKNKKFLIVEYNLESRIDGKMRSITKEIKDSLNDWMVNNHIKVRRNDLLIQRPQSSIAKNASCETSGIEYDTYLRIKVKKVLGSNNKVKIYLSMIKTSTNNVALNIEPITVVNVPQEIMTNFDKRVEDTHYKGYELYPFDEKDFMSEMGSYLAKNINCIAEQRGINLSNQIVYIDASNIKEGSYESGLAEYVIDALKDKGISVVEEKNKSTIAFKATTQNNGTNRFTLKHDTITSSFFYTPSLDYSYNYFNNKYNNNEAIIVKQTVKNRTRAIAQSQNEIRKLLKESIIAKYPESEELLKNIPLLGDKRLYENNKGIVYGLIFKDVKDKYKQEAQRVLNIFNKRYEQFRNDENLVALLEKDYFKLKPYEYISYFFDIDFDAYTIRHYESEIKKASIDVHSIVIDNYETFLQACKIGIIASGVSEKSLAHAELIATANLVASTPKGRKIKNVFELSKNNGDLNSYLLAETEGEISASTSQLPNTPNCKKIDGKFLECITAKARLKCNDDNYFNLYL